MSLQTGLLLLLPHYAQSSHKRYNCATRLPAAQSWDAHLPRRGRPSAAGGARRRLVWRHRRRLAIVLSYTGSLTACLRCCCVESRRPPHCASCTVGSRSQSAMRRAYSSVSTAPREPGAVRARPRQRAPCPAVPPAMPLLAAGRWLRAPGWTAYSVGVRLGPAHPGSTPVPTDATSLCIHVESVCVYAFVCVLCIRY